MSKARGSTATGKIEHYLRCEGKDKAFTVEELANKFSTSEQNVCRVLRGLRANGWTIDQKYSGYRGLIKPTYLAVQPQGIS